MRIKKIHIAIVILAMLICSTYEIKDTYNNCLSSYMENSIEYDSNKANELYKEDLNNGYISIGLSNLFIICLGTLSYPFVEKVIEESDD